MHDRPRAVPKTPRLRPQIYMREVQIDRTVYGPFLLLLEPQQLAVIAMHCTLHAIMELGGTNPEMIVPGQTRVTRLAVTIGRVRQGRGGRPANMGFRRTRPAGGDIWSVVLLARVPHQLDAWSMGAVADAPHPPTLEPCTPAAVWRLGVVLGLIILCSVCWARPQTPTPWSPSADDRKPGEPREGPVDLPQACQGQPRGRSPLRRGAKGEGRAERAVGVLGPKSSLPLTGFLSTVQLAQPAYPCQLLPCLPFLAHVHPHPPAQHAS